ncbi:MAG: hypothetical protein WBN40_03295, partial [Pseudomonadales bacterium]
MKAIFSSGYKSSNLRLLLAGLLLLLPGMALAQFNILFYGNSYTYEWTSSNPDLPAVPDLVKDIALRAGQASPTTAEVTYAAATLTGHANNNVIPAPPGGETWDFVVMQDRSNYPLSTSPPGNLTSHLGGAVALYNDVAAGGSPQIVTPSPNVIPVMFQTWAREQSNSEYYGASGYFPNGNPSQMQAELQSGYALAANAIDNNAGSAITLIAPVGDGWELANWANLHDPDTSHMNARGRLLSALIIYSTIYNDDTHDLYLAGSLDTLLTGLGLGSTDGNFLTTISDTITGLLVVPVADVAITELFVNAENPGSPADQGQEYFELTSASGTAESLDGLTLIYIDRDGGNTGVVDIALNLTGLSTGSNGVFVWSDGNGAWDPAADPATVINIG